jgi:DNA-binding transcriptional ArsR family regulator
MVQHDTIDRTFAALAAPARRGILERLGRGDATISELAEPAGMSLTGMKKHVRVLEEAELVVTAKVGRERQCSLSAGGLHGAETWLVTYRRAVEERLDRLADLLDRTGGTNP